MASLNGGVSQKTCVVSVEEFKNALGKDRGAFKDYQRPYTPWRRRHRLLRRSLKLKA
jgi:hypothetical protein